eukprot:COSAG01_NODE_119_length_25410_cov_1333.312275_30_plen_293_part_00
MLLNWALCSAGLLVLLLVADVAYAVLCTGCTARDAVQLILAHWGIMEPPPRLLTPTHAAATSSSSSSSSSGSPDDAGEKFTVAQERMFANVASPGRLSTAALQRKSRATTERGTRPGTSPPAREPLMPPLPVRTTAKRKAAPKDAAARSKKATTTDGNSTGAMPAPLWSASSYETTPAILRQRRRRAEGKAGAGWACCGAPPSSAAARPNSPRPSRPLPPPRCVGALAAVGCLGTYSLYASDGGGGRRRRAIIEVHRRGGCGCKRRRHHGGTVGRAQCGAARLHAEGARCAR